MSSTTRASAPGVVGLHGSTHRDVRIPGRIPAAVAAVLAGLVAYPVLESGFLTIAESAFLVTVCWAVAVVGLGEWAREPWNPVGPLLCVFAIGGLLSMFQATDSAATFTVGYALSALSPIALAHLLLCYPDGRLADRVDRLAVRLGYLVAVPMPLLVLLVYDPAQHASGINDCRPGSERGCPESILAVAADETLYDVVTTVQLVVYSLAAVGFLVLVARRARRASHRSRWLFAGLLAVAVLAATRVIVANALYVQQQAHVVDRVLTWTAVLSQGAIVAVVIVGLLRRRLANAAVSDLVVELERSPPVGLEQAIARAVGDPSLQLAFWLPDRQQFVNGEGEQISIHERGERGITRLERDGTLLGVILHDPALQDEPGLATAGAATRLALENARLQAEVRAQLAQVQQSRQRIVHAADAERRRLERDIHDGAQQRLVALALQLRIAERRFESAQAPEVERLIAGAVDELQRAVTELRELARGVYPAILTEEGLGAALVSLAARTPVPVIIEELPGERFPADIEAAMYFVACEALANAVKHSGATEVRVDVRRDASEVAIRVADNGRGGAEPSSGSGLSGLDDRVAAHRGRLDVVSPRGGGTTIVARIPCGR
jgi:signal transduction histidine kinase